MPEDEKEKEKIEIKEDEALIDATDAAAMAVPDEWWRHSAFVIKDEPETVCGSAPPEEMGDLYAILKDLLPALRSEGELKLRGRVLRGLTEWIPGVDSVSDLMPETWLPPLPPAITTLMKVYVDEKGDEPGGGGHLNMMVDLSGSMDAHIGNTSSGTYCNVITAAMCMCMIMINGCQAGGHTFAINGFGNGRGSRTLWEIPNPEGDSFISQINDVTRMIWGVDSSQRKNYQGAIASMNNQASTGEMSNLWGGMGGTRSGAGMARLYYMMKDQFKSSEIRVAPAIFLSDMLPSDLDVPADAYEMQGNFPVIKKEVIDKYGKDDTRQYGFWYWAKKYHDDFGPVICVQLIPERYKDQLSPQYVERLRQGFVQYVGGGEKGYAKCLCSTEDYADPLRPYVYMSPTGGNLRKVAKEVQNFIANMSGEGDVECGGKGVTF